jgi:hypothetical protein
MFLMRKYKILGFFIISILSIILAILFWVLPSNIITDGLGPTTDSLWQIGKLMFTSILLYSIFEYFVFGKSFKNFIFAESSTLFIGPLLYIGFGYITDTIFKSSTLNNHIIAYSFALIIGLYISYFIMKEKYYFKLMNAYALVGILTMIIICFSFGSYTDNFEGPIFKSTRHYVEYIRLP